MDASNWKIDIAGIAQLKDGMHGLGGVSFIGSTGASAHWRMKVRHSVIEIAYLSQPDAGAFTVEADDKPLGVVETALAPEHNTRPETPAEDTAEQTATQPKPGTPARSTPPGIPPSSPPAKNPGYATFRIPEGATKFTVRVTRGTVRLYGVEFRTGANGVMYSSLGINGANVTLLSRSFNGPHWTAELRHYKPDLVIVNYGTNESGYAKFVDTTWGPEMREVVRRLHAALPDTAVLLMSPMDRGEKNDAGKIETVKVLPRLVNIESRVASETGVAFFNTFEAMGGAGTMARWYTSEPRLVSADFIHPMPAGAKIVGELLYDALRDGYNDYKLRQLDHSTAVSNADSKATSASHPNADSPQPKAGAPGQPKADSSGRRKTDSNPPQL
jgi:lysophospholipase L1-like esterase